MASSPGELHKAEGHPDSPLASPASMQQQPSMTKISSKSRSFFASFRARSVRWWSQQGPDPDELPPQIEQPKEEEKPKEPQVEPVSYWALYRCAPRACSCAASMSACAPCKPSSFAAGSLPHWRPPSAAVAPPAHWHSPAAPLTGPSSACGAPAARSTRRRRSSRWWLGPIPTCCTITCTRDLPALHTPSPLTPAPTPPSSLPLTHSYADGWDRLLIVVGLIGAVGAGVMLPLFSIVFGDFMWVGAVGGLGLWLWRGVVGLVGVAALGLGGVCG